MTAMICVLHFWVRSSVICGNLHAVGASSVCLYLGCLGIKLLMHATKLCIQTIAGSRLPETEVGMCVQLGSQYCCFAPKDDKHNKQHTELQLTVSMKLQWSLHSFQCSASQARQPLEQYGLTISTLA